MTSCTGCGAAFKPAARYCVRCGTAKGGTMACARCATVHTADDAYCAQCGLKLGAAPEPTPAPAVKDTRMLWLVGGMFLGAVLSGGGALVFWIVEGLLG